MEENFSEFFRKILDAVVLGGWGCKPTSLIKMGVDNFFKKRVGYFRNPFGGNFDLHVSRRSYVSDKWLLCVSESVPSFSELDVTLLHVDFAWSLQECDYLIS